MAPTGPIILGLNAYHGDAAAALIAGGEVVAAVAEERLNRIKHAAGFPRLAVARVLADAGVEPGQLTAIAVGRDRRAHRGRKLLHVALDRPRPGAVLPRLAARRKLAGVRAEVADALGLGPGKLDHVPVDRVEHHLAHAASAFHGAGWPEAAVVTADGFGDFVSTAWGVGKNGDVALQGRVFYPHSLGVLYQAVTQYIGFVHYGDEGKTMGLAPYGKPRFVDAIRRMIAVRPDGSFRLAGPYFRHLREGVATAWTGSDPEVGPLYTDAWAALFGPPRRPDEPRGEREADLAHSVQAVLEDVLLALITRHHGRTGQRRIALAGGVALNSVLNGKIRRTTPFEETYVFPAAGDDGLAVGAAWVSHRRRGGATPAPVRVPLWGPAFPTPAAGLDLSGLPGDGSIARRDVAAEDLHGEAAKALAAGHIVGWFQGRMEFGPRALGARSILADPRDPGMRERLNARIKHREPFRPFAPAVLADRVGDWFEDPEPSPAMLHVLPIRPDCRDRIPAVTHVDGTGRLQTVDPIQHPDFAALLRAFDAETGVPILLNTSFNENEPIVCTPQQALDCFLRTDMDVLVVAGMWFERVREAA